MKKVVYFILSLIITIVCVVSILKTTKEHQEEMALIEAKEKLAETCTELWGYNYQYYRYKLDCLKFVESIVTN